MPEISVIIPVYNVEKYLKKCLDSLTAQTFTDWEAICIDDGSPDNCGIILDEYASKDTRFKVIHQKNQGLSIARNNGLKKAKGNYIYFLDSDDSLHPQCLEIAHKYATENNADIVNFDFYRQKEKITEIKAINLNKIKTKKTSNPVFFVCNRNKFNIPFNVWTKLYKKEILNGIDFIPDIHFEDFPHTIAILAKNPKTILIDAKLYFYTLNLNSISFKNANPKQIQDFHTGINFIYEFYKKPEFKKELKSLKRKFIPSILKQQLNRCIKADKSIQKEMLKAFSEELIDLNQKDLISWRGHKLKRFFTYLRLIKKGSI